MGSTVTIHGVPVRLESPHTLDSVEADMAFAASRRRPLLCWLRHRRQVIGKPMTDSPNLGTRTLAVAGSQVVNAVTRCRRCKKIETRSSW